MPLLLAQVILSWLSGLLTSKTGNYRYILMAGYFIMTVAAGEINFSCGIHDIAELWKFFFFISVLLNIGLNAFFESPVLIATLDEHSTQVKQVGLLLMIGMATGCKSLDYI